MSPVAAVSKAARAALGTSLACLAADAVAAQRVPRRPAPVAIVGVSVIDPASARPVATGQTIVVAGGLIRAIGPSGSIAIPREARRIPAQGEFVIPGLWDAHVHFMNTGVSALPLLLAQGVTSVREMGGYIDSTRAWQARMRAGTLAGPRIITPGPVLESPRYLQGVRDRSVRDPRLAIRVLPYRLSVGDSLDAARAIDSLVKLHVDFVKVRTTATPETYYAILRNALRAGLKVAGNQPTAVSLTSALDSGQYDVEHAIAPPLNRLPDSTRESTYRQFARLGSWYTPTLVISRVVSLSGDSASRAIFGPDAVRADERRPYASPWLLEWWRMQVDEQRQRRAADVGRWRQDPRRHGRRLRAHLSRLQPARGAAAARRRRQADAARGAVERHGGTGAVRRIGKVARCDCARADRRSGGARRRSPHGHSQHAPHRRGDAGGSAVPARRARRTAARCAPNGITGATSS